MRNKYIMFLGISLALSISLLGCGGSGSPPTPVTTHSVTLTWAPNHESGVNSAGGGYQVSISGQPMINVPYVSGPTATTSATTSLQTGSYVVTVRAYAALDPQGGRAGSQSAPSQSLTVIVP